MRNRFFIYIGLAFLLLIHPITAQTITDSDELRFKSVLNNILTKHFDPLPINDNFSERVFDLYLERLDYSKRFFLRNDIEQLQVYEKFIDEEFQAGSFDFYKTATTLYKKRIEEVATFAPSLLNKPFDFSKDESLYIDPKQRPYPKDESAQKELWRQLLKYQALQDYMNLYETKQKDIPTENRSKAITFDPKLEKEAREKVQKSLTQFFERAKENTDDDYFEMYLDSISNSFDPHTSYFAPQKKEDFDISISGQLEGIGAVLREDEDYIKVVEVIPGSAAWRQKQLEAGDLILKVGQGGQEPVDIVGSKVRDAVKLIRGKKGTEVRLTVKKTNGQTIVIPIVRDVVVIEETYAKAVEIKTPSQNKAFGYIMLPSFYRDFKNNNNRNATDDISKILSQFNPSISGLILDLRNNGGGSLTDAINTSGLFINEGPIVQVKTNMAAPAQAEYDPNPNISYSGPIIVLVNEYSASASEILSAALQDYKRAVIVGAGSHTFGKGTVQRFFDLDQFAYRYPLIINPQINDSLGSLKLTVQKFFRINGGATQFKGVIPDVVLPALNSHKKSGERELTYPLPWSETTPLAYKKWTKTKYSIDKMQLESDKRTAKNPIFTMITEFDQYLKKTEDEPESLSLNTAWQKKEYLEDTNKKLKTLKDVQSGFTLKPVNYEKRTSENTEAFTENQKEVLKEKEKSNEKWLQDLSTDPYLVEAIHMLENLN